MTPKANRMADFKDKAIKTEATRLIHFGAL